MFDNENDFVNLSNESSKNLNDLDAAFTDPFIAHVLEMGRTYNQIFQETSPSAEEIASAVEDLDEEWGNIKGAAIQYTGSVEVRDLEDKRQTKRVFLDGAQVVSNGFHVKFEDTPIGNTYTVRHHLLVNFKDAYGIDSKDSQGKFAGASGDIDSSFIELESASAERAKAWLSASCPELIEEIDFRALNASGGEDEALLSLRGLDFNRYTDLNDTFTRNCLEIYLQSILEVDTAAPYAAKLNGCARSAEDSTTLYTLKADAVLVKIGAIGMQPSFNVDESDTDWSLSAYISLLGVDRTHEPQYYVLPVESIQELQSIRTAYYTSND